MISYRVIPRKNPQTKAVKYYASVKTNQQVSLATVCEQIAEECALTTADVKACIDRLERHVKLQLLAGNSVKLGELGTFRPTLASRGTDSVKEFGVDKMKQVRVRFQPSPELKEALRVGGADVSFRDLTREIAQQSSDTTAG